MQPECEAVRFSFGQNEIFGLTFARLRKLNPSLRPPVPLLIGQMIVSRGPPIPHFVPDLDQAPLPGPPILFLAAQLPAISSIAIHDNISLYHPASRSDP